ncbi:MAG: LolA family protein [Bacteroidota bacterium]
MKNIAFLLLFIPFLQPLTGQQQEPEVQDPRAGEVLDKLARKTKTAKNIYATFDYDYSDKKSGDEYNQEGNILIAGEKYRITLPEMVIFYDGEALFTYLPDVNEVNITDPDEETGNFFMSNPLNLFNIYKSDFKYRFLEETGQYYELALYPFNRDNLYHTIKLKVDKEETRIYQAEALGKKGEVFKVTLFSYQTDMDYSEEDVTFDPANYPDVMINDMRF